MEQVAGSEAAFVAMMRDTLASGAPRRTVFLNGVSHARDLGYADIVERFPVPGLPAA